MNCNFLFSLFFFLLGASVGSFLNCLVYRLEKEESFLRGRSFCPHCRHTLSWKDLIPILSFFLLRGKCRYCHRKISWQYPLVELLTAFLFLIFWQKFQSNFLDLIFLLSISSFLIVIFIYDLKHYLIPDSVIYPAIFISFFWKLTLLACNKISFSQLIIIFLSATIFALFFFFLYFFSKGKAMGLGDVNLAFLMGMILGWPNILPAFFLSVFLGATVGLFLVFSQKKNLKSEIPFAPFLVAGTFLAIFFGSQMVDFYLKIFLPF